MLWPCEEAQHNTIVSIQFIALNARVFFAFINDTMIGEVLRMIQVQFRLMGFVIIAFAIYIW